MPEGQAQCITYSTIKNRSNTISTIFYTKNNNGIIPATGICTAIIFCISKMEYYPWKSIYRKTVLHQTKP